MFGQKDYQTQRRRQADILLSIILLASIALAVSLEDMDYKFGDWLYKKPGAASQDIIVIGVDSTTIEKKGPLASWIRRDMSKAIDILNADPAARPAAIGLDFLFTGKNPDAPEFDKRLVETIGKYSNVVLASAVIMDDDDLEDSQNPFAQWEQTWQGDYPFPEMINAADIAHICEPYDADGIVRHQLLYVKTTEHGRLYSFARVLYEKWCQHKKISPNPPPLTEGNGLYYLPFTAKSYSRGFNFADLLDGKIPPNFYKDKIVLIGSYAPGMGDEFSTALDRSALVYGIDIHANSIQAFQNGFFPRELNQNAQIFILVLVGFLSGLLFRNGKMQQILAQWLIICFSWLDICQVLYGYGIILHALWIPLTVSVLFVGAVATNYTRARTEKDKVMSTFGRYVDPTIMSQLLNEKAESLDVGGTLKNIAVLFVDIRGFTTMSEQLPPTVVVEILNRYLTLTSECIRRHHGTLDKFVGDCTMAFWNAPIPQKNPVHLACRAALDMIKGSKKLKQQLKEQYGREIDFGIGVHWGSAVVGNIGSPFRMDYTAIGDTVNTAARLEANAPGGKIFISRAVADILGSKAVVTSLGNSIKLKGKTDGFEVLTLDSLEGNGGNDIGQ